MKRGFSYIQKGQQSFPVINIKCMNNRNALVVKALVDSGASFSVFRPEIAEHLGIKLEQGKQIYLEGIGGRILGYLHRIKVEVAGKSFLCKIVFSRELTISFNLLGRNNFFIPFLITFNEKAKIVSFD